MGKETILTAPNAKDTNIYICFTIFFVDVFVVVVLCVVIVVVIVVVGVFVAVCTAHFIVVVIDGIFVDVVVLSRQAGTYQESSRPCSHIFQPGILSGTPAYTQALYIYCNQEGVRWHGLNNSFHRDASGYEP